MGKGIPQSQQCDNEGKSAESKEAKEQREMRGKSSTVKVVVTQPRRVAAI